ncbi:TetR/AcrR family transcriptional regulator [Beijerinckia indica]|uniref:Transcriptional regulator, TetR family n=1 Tax=Beijerinckia indica subsp. indica (strain ATCC 9039 / DSM 1715 / NCIMB 8712) TaxID=395963 RepID=B2IFZ6_BEII9|nr:TetR/AcrR family transcriptional regulator [Beijerinckia indica]ACB95735.1 transcriptional regulator, TetR family [Beijerinckia indica subsp. indica ATCC 9039]
MDAPIAPAPSPRNEQDNAKRRQILDGAREVFLAQGFDAASMNEIARKAGVSKGTLYVYFTSKEQLFQTVTHEACMEHAKHVFCLDLDDHDIEAVLTRLGRGFVTFLCRQDFLSPLRTVISIADRMPELGREFYEAGPSLGITMLQRYLEREVSAGNLMIEDCEVAAAQFLDSCLATIFRPLLFNTGTPLTEARINHVVGIAVRVFLAAYRNRK